MRKLKPDKTERAELYKDRNTQVFLSKLLGNETIEIEPAYNSQVGYQYPIIETILAENESAEDFLNRLYEAGVLKRKLYDKVIHCPKCGSPNISARYGCPYCKSFDIQRSSLIEHIKCGYMDVEKNFQKGKGLLCPKCHESLKKVDRDFRKAGIWCTCNECNKSFDIPVVTQFCRDCHLDSSFEDAIITDIYSYGLNEEVKKEISLDWIMITPVRDFIKEKGFTVDSPAFVKGKSGASHVFDIAAVSDEHPENVTVIDLATSSDGMVTEQPVIALFAKVYDVSPSSAYLIAIPNLSVNARKMAELYNIQIIEAKTQKEVIETLKAKMLE